MIVKFLNRAKVSRPCGGDDCCLIESGRDSSQICNGKMPRNRASFQHSDNPKRLIYSLFSDISVQILGKGRVCLFTLADFLWHSHLRKSKTGRE